MGTSVLPDALGRFSPLLRTRREYTTRLLYCGIQGRFLGNRVAGLFPGEHVLVASLLICILGTKDNRVVGLDLAAVLLHGVFEADIVWILLRSKV